MAIYQGRALSNQKVLGRDTISRRDFLKRSGEYGLGFFVLDLAKNPITDTLNDIFKETPDIANIGRDENGLYAKFRDHNFRFIEDYLVEKKDYFSPALQEEEQPNAVLYRVNHSKNPNFKIKGDRLDRLRDLAGIVNSHSDVIRNLKQGEEIKLPWNSKTLNTLKPGAYFIPHYNLQK